MVPVSVCLTQQRINRSGLYPGSKSQVVVFRKLIFVRVSTHIITTLTETSIYRAKAIADLYFQRWDVELFFRDIKTTMGMGILRCQSPSMIRKELLMHFIVYNCLRLLMLKAADKADVPVRLISFKASVQEVSYTHARGVESRDVKNEGPKTTID